MRRELTRAAKDQSAVTAIEYALIAGLISMVIVGVVTQIGNDVATLFFGSIAANL
jgi:pilus assembly protein Flp/PilA